MLRGLSQLSMEDIMRMFWFIVIAILGLTVACVGADGINHAKDLTSLTACLALLGVGLGSVVAAGSQV